MSIDVSILRIAPTPILQDRLELSNPVVRLLSGDDGERLARYFAELSDRTRSLFAPHPFTPEEAHRIVAAGDEIFRYVVASDERVVGYFLLYPGLHDSDKARYTTYGIDTVDCASFAPSVCDEFQGRGVGGAAFRVIRKAAEDARVRCLTLMGGVQARNQVARKYYTALGYQEIAHFQTTVDNIDMMLPLTDAGGPADSN